MEDWVGTVEQGGMVVAEVWAATEREVVREVSHYAMMYGQDGPVIVRVTPPTPDRNPEGEKPQALSAEHESGLPEGSSE